MKAFFDTSVLVPVFHADHIHHQSSFDLFVQFNPQTGFCSAHTLAEVYSTLTRMPGKHRISPDQAMLFIQLPIRADHGNIVIQSLRGNHPVKRILMHANQPASPQAILHSDHRKHTSGIQHPHQKIFLECGRLRQSAKTDFGSDLPR